MTKFQKTINILLMLTFVVTMLMPITGIAIHKMASALFLLLCIIHTVIYRKKLGVKKYLILAIVFFAFISGMMGMIWEQYPIVIQLHKAISIISVFFLAIHIFVYHKRYSRKQNTSFVKVQ